LGWTERPRWLLALTCACCLLLTGRMTAEPRRSESWVEVLIAGSNTEVGLMAEALDDQFRRLEVRVRIRTRKGQVPKVKVEEVLSPSERAAVAVARMWFDLTEPGQAALYITDGEWKRIYVRRLPLPQGLDEVAREQLTYIARTSVETLLAGGEIGVTREEFTRRLPVRAPPPHARTQSPEPPPEPSWNPGIGVFYQVGSYADRVPIMHGPGWFASLLKSGSPLRPRFTLAGELYVEQRAETADVIARLNGTALSLTLGLELSMAHALVFRASLGTGVDFVRVTPQRASEATVSLSPPFWAIDPAGGVWAGLGYALGSLKVGLTGGADVATRSSHYVVWREGERLLIYSPNRVRPGARVELGWEFR
jgi:hypothetical protein